MRELHGDWRDIFLGFSIAKDPRKVCLATVGLIITLLLVMLFASLADWGEFIKRSSAHEIVKACRELPSNPVKNTKLVAKRLGGISDLQYSKLPQHIVDVMLLKGIGWRYHGVQKVIFLLFVFVAALFIWSRFGVSICRIAAIEFAKDERIELSEARKFAKKKWGSLFWTPIVPLIGIAFFAACLILGGIIGCIPKGVGTFLVSLGFPLAILAGFIITLIVVGGVAGAALMFPAVSAEGTDAFDGISRAYSYVYTKPWRLLWYYLVAAVYGAVCIAFVYAFACLVVQATLTFGGFGMRQFSTSGRDGLKAISYFILHYGHFDMAHTTKLGFLGKVGVSIAGTFLTLVYCVAIGFAISYCFTASTIVYFLMRKAVDGTELTEIYTDEEEDFGQEISEPAAEENAEEREEETEEEEAEAEEKTEEKAEEKGSRKNSPAGKKKTRKRKSSKKKDSES
ncbi:MAG: hypothetical protein GXP25_20210 [Planctomycetes bacterium]|nr:hypothetical protein [Planctomycetota bacterium]